MLNLLIIVYDNRFHLDIQDSLSELYENNNNRQSQLRKIHYFLLFIV